MPTSEPPETGSGAARPAPGVATAGVAGSEGTRVKLDDVTKAFGDNVVLDELNLTVEPGEKVVVIGPSGSGKTTILRVIMTLENIQGGYIWLGDEELYHTKQDDRMVRAKEKHTRQVRKKVSMVFQHFYLFPHKTVLDNITLGPIKALDFDKDTARDRAHELLDGVGLAEKADQYPAQLSGGQKQRVAIARALAMEPEVLLFDEVTSALDPELVGEVLGVLRDIALNSNVTMMLVTHEIGFAREIADRVVMFDAGKVVEQAPPSELLSDPKEQRTKDFLHAVLEH